MKNRHISAILLIISAILAYKFVIEKQYAIKHQLVQESNIKYEYDLAVLNKSFKRDLERSAILYQSFEKFFIGYENVPFYIVIPEKELELFKDRFQELKANAQIKYLPKFLSEQEILKKAGEPDVTYDGGWAQQVIKLSFGLTNIAKNYIMIDSDNYFTKNFDPKIIMQENTLKTVAWKLPDTEIEKYKNRTTMQMALDTRISQEFYTRGLTQNVYKSLVLIKDFFGNNTQTLYSFVTTPFFFSSDAIHKMRDLIEKKGGYSFAMLIKLVPFEMQWYGEYILQHENFIPQHGIFKIVNNPDECVPEDGGENMYGLWFQSVIYDFSDKNLPADNNQYIYKRPKHCDVVK